MKYLVVFEAPCVGTSEEIVGFPTDKDASDWAWEHSCNVREYLPGAYDIYRLTYNHEAHTHQLELVDEVALWAAEEVEE